MDGHPFGWLSVLPPVVAIVLAIATRRIVFSLVIGVFAGSLLMAHGQVVTALYQTWETHLWRTLIDPDKLRVFSFTLLMGALVGVITRSGGMLGLINLVTPWAHNRRRGQMTTWFLGLAVFFDDYANTILLGSTLRPICDRLRISREKLAYLVDSTAAPVAGIALVSTWVAVEVDYIASGLESLPGSELSAFDLFIATIPYRFYVITALCLVPMTALLGRDFGSMWRAEQAAASGLPSPGRIEVVGEDHHPRPAGWYHAVLPLLLTLVLVVFFIYRTGAQHVCEDRSAEVLAKVSEVIPQDLQPQFQDALRRLSATAATGDVRRTQAALRRVGDQLADLVSPTEAGLFSRPFGLRDIVGSADSSLALQYGAIAGLMLALGMSVAAGRLSYDQAMGSAMAGARVVLPAVMILWTASAMSRMTTDISVDGESSAESYPFRDHRLYTATFLTSVMAGSQEAPHDGAVLRSSRYLPTVVFVLAAVVSFCTGTSWGTMGILVPMVIQTASAILVREGGSVSADHPVFLGAMAGVLSGAVFGDHCSPISDTTVLSSQASGCDHMAHVRTQLPYALLAAGVSILLGTLPVGFGVPVWLLLAAQITALLVILRCWGSPVTVRQPDQSA